MKMLLTLATAALLAGTYAASELADDRIPTQLKTPLKDLPTSIGGWTLVNTSGLEPRVEQKLAATEYVVRTYRKGDLDLDLFIAYYAMQAAGESMHSPDNCLPGSGWEIWDYGTIEVPAQERTKINEYHIQNGTTRALALYWYQTPERIYASEYAGKIFLIWDALTKRATSGSIIRIVGPDDSADTSELREFASLVMSQMRTAF